MIAKRTLQKDRVYYQSFYGHIEDALKILKAYFEKKNSILSNFSQRWGLNQTTLMKDLFLCVAFHDIGKLTKQFQENIYLGKTSSKYPHALFGVPVLLKIPFELFNNLPLSILAILGHHSQLHRNIYHSSNIAKKVDFIEDEIRDFIEYKTFQLYEILEFNQYFNLDELDNIKIDFNSRDEIVDKFIIPSSKANTKDDRYRLKSIFSYIFSILQLCDDYSSSYFNKYIEQNEPANTNLGSTIDNTQEFVYDIDFDLSEIRTKIFGNFSPYKFQKELEEKEKKFSFLFAPCGRGKTEAALMWAFKLKKKFNRDKIIFALPTQVTCNAMYERLTDKREYGFEEKTVGLYHGKSLIALKYNAKNKINFELEDFYPQTEEYDYKSYDLLKDENFKGNVFFKPITVTTIDHLAYAFIHGFSQADFACGNLQNSIIIFDEIHYYENHTIKILLRLFNILRKMDIPHLLMTGTAPEFLLKNIRKNYEIVTDSEGLQYQPFYISKKEVTNLIQEEGVYEQIINNYNEGKNIFIILNQVQWAQDFYKNLKNQFESESIEPNLILYHSRFIHKDRVEKEEEIRKKVKQKPCVLVTTQVIEISLDISADVMYTTIAPPDAIGQRAGRLNRSGKTYKNEFLHELKLFNIENNLPYDEELLKSAWENFYEGVYSYNNIKEVCDNVYDINKLLKSFEYNRLFEDNKLFGDHHKVITYGDDEGKKLKIRPDNFQQVDVVPSSVFYEAEAQVNSKQSIWAEYEVKIPIYKLYQDIKEFGELYHFKKHENHKIMECSYKYDYEFGIQFDEDNFRTQII